MKDDSHKELFSIPLWINFEVEEKEAIERESKKDNAEVQKCKGSVAIRFISYYNNYYEIIIWMNAVVALWNKKEKETVMRHNTFY